METLKDRYSITELSERLQVTDHALRYYEKEFNITVPKDDRGRRYYTTELANLMYQIKNMRDEGLELKAIKKLLFSDENIHEPPTVVPNDTVITMVPVARRSSTVDITDIKAFFDEFKEQITVSVSNEITNSSDHLTRELNKTKLELGACVENSMRKLESRMEKHFQDVDRSLGYWREKNNKSPLKKLLKAFR